MGPSQSFLGLFYANLEVEWGAREEPARSNLRRQVTTFWNWFCVKNAPHALTGRKFGLPPHPDAAAAARALWQPPCKPASEAPASHCARAESEAEAAKVKGTRGARLAATRLGLGWNVFYAARGLHAY